MSRPSKADLRVVSLPGRGRPEPPEQLDDAETRAWQAIVDASPDGFLDGAGQLILRQVVTQVALGERHARHLRKMAEAGVDDVEAEITIGRAHAEAMKNTVHGMTALRATPKSRMRSRDSARAFDRSPSGRRPWEVRAPTIEAEGADGDESA
jgi:hypothetical protein